MAVLAIPTMQEFAYLRAMYPFESMEARVPAPKAMPRGTTLPSSNAQRLNLLEERVPEHSSIREFLLKTLHEDAVG